jgi:hypothetical protein
VDLSNIGLGFKGESVLIKKQMIYDLLCKNHALVEMSFAKEENSLISNT